MVFPIILTVLAFLSVPFLVLNAAFWLLYQAVGHVDPATPSWFWALADNQIPWQTGLTLVALLDAWAVSRCVFIFDSFGHPRTLLLARPIVATVLGTLCGVLYSAVLLWAVHRCNLADPAALALWRPGGALAWWLLVGALQGLAISVGGYRGLSRTVAHTATLEPSTPTLLFGRLEDVMVPLSATSTPPREPQVR